MKRNGKHYCFVCKKPARFWCYFCKDWFCETHRKPLIPRPAFPNRREQRWLSEMGEWPTPNGHPDVAWVDFRTKQYEERKEHERRHLFNVLNLAKWGVKKPTIPPTTPQGLLKAETTGKAAAEQKAPPTKKDRCQYHACRELETLTQCPHCKDWFCKKHIRPLVPHSAFPTEEEMKILYALGEWPTPEGGHPDYEWEKYAKARYEQEKERAYTEYDQIIRGMAGRKVRVQTGKVAIPEEIPESYKRWRDEQEKRIPQQNVIEQAAESLKELPVEAKTWLADEEKKIKRKELKTIAVIIVLLVAAIAGVLWVLQNQPQAPVAVAKACICKSGELACRGNMVVECSKDCISWENRKICTMCRSGACYKLAGQPLSADSLASYFALINQTVSTCLDGADHFFEYSGPGSAYFFIYMQQSVKPKQWEAVRELNLTSPSVRIRLSAIADSVRKLEAAFEIKNSSRILSELPNLKTSSKELQASFVSLHSAHQAIEGGVENEPGYPYAFGGRIYYDCILTSNTSKAFDALTQLDVEANPFGGREVPDSGIEITPTPAPVLDCSDGTLNGACSLNKPKRCENGALVDAAQVCGCPLYHTPDGNTCKRLFPCSDGTSEGTCSAQKPQYCQSGVLVNKASICGCPGGLQQSGDECVSTYLEGPAARSFVYVLRGSQGMLSFTAYKGLRDHLASLSRSYYCYGGICPSNQEIELRYLDEEYQRPQLMELVNTIKSLNGNRDDQARLAISLVQQIPYDWEGFRSGNLRGRYPYEVLYDDEGVCGEKSHLLAFILRELGFSVALLDYPQQQHQAVGIKCPLQYSVAASNYCFVETASPSIVTDNSADYVGVGQLSANPVITQISDGASFDSVAEEYNDAQTMIRINQLGKLSGGVVDQYSYYQWYNLVAKYGIKTS